MIYQVCYR